MSGRVLLVDDQKSILLHIKAILSSEGYNVVIASSGEEAFTLIQQAEAFDLVISDAIMPPGMDGYQLIKKIKTFNSKTPVILLTGKREKEDVIKGIQAGADDYIVKPVDPQLLIMKVQQIAPISKGQFEIVSASLNEEAEAKGLIQIQNISEMGVEVFADVPLIVGKKIVLNSLTLEKIGLVDVSVRVDQVDPVLSGYVAKATFVGLTEKQLSPLRLWIRNKNMRAA